MNEIKKINYNLNINYNKLLGHDWAGVLEDSLLKTDYMKNLMLFIHEMYKSNINIYPKKELIFQSFQRTGLGDVRVVILCREPYTNFRSMGIPLANKDEFGRVFSPELTTWASGVEKAEYDKFQMYNDPTLLHLTRQGVMLLDVALTSEENKIMAHKIYWKNFIRQTVKTICEWCPGTIFVLLGKEAKEFKHYINEQSCYIIDAQHPYEAITQKTQWDTSLFKEIDKILINNNGEAAKIIW